MPPESPPRPLIIALIGSPGAGKYTIASRVAPLVGARLVDNHSIANVLFNLLDQDGVKPMPPEIWPLLEEVRKTVFRTLTEVSPLHLSFVFTNYMQGDDPQSEAVFQEIAAIAEIRRSTFVPVLVRCETPELLRRVVGEDRRARMKLVDPVLAGRINDEVPPFVTTHANTLEIDVTHVPSDESAARIVEWAKTCLRREASDARD